MLLYEYKWQLWTVSVVNKARDSKAKAKAKAKRSKAKAKAKAKRSKAKAKAKAERCNAKAKAKDSIKLGQSGLQIF
jgi:FKBP-type peptidyl-prolyl cis-trans isomerase